MARDRKRSSGRRKRPSGKDPEEVSREIGLGGDDVEDAGLGEIAPPDTLAGATPYVDEAKAAEAGADVPEPGESVPAPDDDEDDFERAPDEVEGDLVPVGSASSEELDPALRDEVLRRRRQRGKVLTFLGHCWDELQRVQWPNRRQVGQATAVVLGFVVLAGGYLGLMDAIWQPIVERII